MFISFGFALFISSFSILMFGESNSVLDFIRTLKSNNSRELKPNSLNNLESESEMIKKTSTLTRTRTRTRLSLFGKPQFYFVFRVVSRLHMLYFPLLALCVTATHFFLCFNAFLLTCRQWLGPLGTAVQIFLCLCPRILHK